MCMRTRRTRRRGRAARTAARHRAGVPAQPLTRLDQVRPRDRPAPEPRRGRARPEPEAPRRHADLPIRTVQPGDVGELDAKLAAGRYTLWCSLANHAALGMRTTLV